MAIHKLKKRKYGEMVTTVCVALVDRKETSLQWKGVTCKFCLNRRDKTMRKKGLERLAQARYQDSYENLCMSRQCVIDTLYEAGK